MASWSLRLAGLATRRRLPLLVLLAFVLELLRRLLRHRLAQPHRLRLLAKAAAAASRRGTAAKGKAKAAGKDSAKKEDAAKSSATLELSGALRDGLQAAREAWVQGGGKPVRLPMTRLVQTCEHLLVSTRTRHGADCQMTVFASQRFGHLRSILGLSENAFWSSLCDADLQGGTTEASGKSGSTFWYTADRLLVLKSLTRGELLTLLEGLGAYAQHFSSNRNSLLCRMFGAFELRMDRQRHIFVVMNYCFAGSRLQPHVVYDLKGTTEDRWVNPRPGVVLKDLNFADKIIGIADFRHKVELLHALKKDIKFLRDRNVMDYSLCLGIHYCVDDANPPPEQLVPVAGVSSPLSIIRGFEPKFQCTLVRDQAARRVVYYIGIIDILQYYNLRKFGANVIKGLSLGWVHEIDTAPPSYYARRLKTMCLGKVQTFQEPGDRVARFVRRLRTGIESGTIPRPTFATVRPPGAPELSSALGPELDFSPTYASEGEWTGQGEEVTMDEAVDFAVRCGSHLMLHRTGWLRSQITEVEVFLDMDRHALVFQVMARGAFDKRRPTTAVACYKIRRVYLSIACHRPRDRYCIACHSPIKIEAEPEESRRFTVEADDTPLRFTAPSRRQAKLWVTALEVAAAYAEANVEDVEEAAAAAAASSPLSGSAPGTHQSALPPRAGTTVRAAVLGALESYLSEKDAARLGRLSRPARLGVLEPFLMGPEAERRWEKRRVKWIFGFVDVDGMGALTLNKVKTLWREMNINDAEGHEVLSHFLKEAREDRRAGGGRQIGGGRLVHLGDFRRMLQRVDAVHARAVRACIGDLVERAAPGPSPRAAPIPSGAARGDETLSPEELAHFFTRVQRVVPAPSASQVRRLVAQLLPPLATRGRGLSPVGLAHLLCSPSNSLTDPAKRLVFQDMTQPLSAYYIETSHNTYLEGNQLSSRSSVLRYVEVLRTGCRSIEVDVWDGKEGEPVVKHGYTVTTEVFFEDVIQAIADHAFVASEYPVIISIEQHCSALQRTRQGEIMMKVLGERLLMPPWDDQLNCISYEKMEKVSPWSARGRFLVKSALGCCERCRGMLPAYDRCIALPTLKLQKHEKDCIKQGDVLDSSQALDNLQPGQEGRYACHVSSMSAGKLLKLRHVAGEAPLQLWNAQHLQRVYPESTMIGSGNIDPVPHWSCGVQMVAMNYQTPDAGLLLNEGLFRSYNGGCGYVLKGSAGPRCGSRLRLRICCGHRLPRPEAQLDSGAEFGSSGSHSSGSAVSSPLVVVGLEPGGQTSQSRASACDGYHPVFDHEVDFDVPDAPFHILTFEVRDAPTSRTMARRAVSLDTVREGFRWLALRTTLGNTIPHGGLLVYAEFTRR